MSDPLPDPDYSHFKDKGALQHIVEAQARGIIASSEAHGAETPGHVSAAADAARETALLLVTLWAILSHLGIGAAETVTILVVTTLGWTLWKLGRSAWLGWIRLERLHRLVAEERWEIEHHRQQEREELRVLYEAKGFRGALLDEAVEVLMADGDRLLRVMIEEELGLSLEVHEHPIKQGLGGAAGALASGLWCSLSCWLLPGYGILFGAAVAMGVSAGTSAYLERNQVIPAVVWNLGIGALAFSTIYFLLDWFGIKG